VGQSSWLLGAVPAADALVGLCFSSSGRAGPRGPSRARASAPHWFAV